MKILFKHSVKFNNSRSTTLELDLETMVSEVRKRISRILDIPLSSFHLLSKRFKISILMTDTWPLSFFLDESRLKIKIKQLDTPVFLRKDSVLTNSSSSEGPFSRRLTSTIQPLDLAILACKCGNLGGLKELISKEDPHEDSLLHQAQECQWGLLHYACASGASDIVRYLVSLQVNSNKVTVDEWTPLQLCSFLGHAECVRELIKHPNIQVNKRTRHRGTALHLACATSNAQVVRILLEKSPVVGIEDHRSRTVFEYVVSQEVFEVLAVYSGQCELQRYKEEEAQVPFCSEVYQLNCFSLSDKVVFLFLDPDTDSINKYLTKENYLDKVAPVFSLKLIEIQDVNTDFRRKDQYCFRIETALGSYKYYTRHEALTLEWTLRIKKATEYCMEHRQNMLVEQIVQERSPVAEDESTMDSSVILDAGNEVVDFSKFAIMDEIGSGSFGIVYKVKKINTEELFAIKSLSKSILQKQKQLKYAISECKIMKQLNHPFIVPLYYTFQTPKHLYLVLELCPNGDLLGLVEKKGKLDEAVAKFYLAEVILALEYLHGSGIIYRDLKPANVLIDSEFHAKLADFGLAKENFNKKNPAMTMAGTPAYLPPEIVEKKGASFSSDIYGLGPLLYELLTGKTPYYDEDLGLLLQNIKTAKLLFPAYLSQHARDLITSVMNKDPSKRPQISQIKRHQLFRKLDWEALFYRRIRPPKIE